MKKIFRISLAEILVIILVFAAFLPAMEAINDKQNEGLTSEGNIDFIKNTKGTFVMENWLEQDKIVASDGQTYDEFGNSVATNGDYAIVGSWGDESDKGAAYIFERDGTSWIQKQKLIASDGEANDEFGISVSIDGNYAIVGASDDDVYTGSVYVFKRDREDWMEEQKLIASDAQTGALFGESVCMDGDYLLIGSRSATDNTFGSGYIFHFDGTSWVEEQKLLASDGVMGDGFGYSVSLSGDYALIGARNDDNYRGSAYVFKRDGSVWTEEQKLLGSDIIPLDYFGWCVSINGDHAIIGAFAKNDLKGAAYVFKRDGSVWTEEQKLLASDGQAYEEFGYSVCIQGNIAVVGASGDDSYRGAAYVFKYDGANWNEVQKLIASDGGYDDKFGQSTLIVDDYLIIGAPWDGSRTGSAYIFKKPSINLDCQGDLNWVDIETGETVQGSLTVENIGESGSMLDWEIQSYPDWGNWTFNPDSGVGLTPEQSPFSVDLEVIAPDESDTEFEGEIIIINSNDPDDFCVIDVTLATPLSCNNIFYLLFQNLLEKFPNALPLLRIILNLK